MIGGSVEPQVSICGDYPNEFRQCGIRRTGETIYDTVRLFTYAGSVGPALRHPGAYGQYPEHP